MSDNVSPENCIEEIYRPERSEWAEILKSHGAAGTSAYLFSETERNNFRQRLLKAAYEYTLALDELTDEHVRLEEPNPTLPIIAAGHQPLIYHMGILEKVRAMHLFKKEIPANSLNILVDIDEGYLADISFPCGTGQHLEVKTKRVSESQSLAFLQPGLDVSRIDDLRAELTHAVTGCGCGPEIFERIDVALELYRKFHYLPLRDLNTLVRRQLSFRSQLELPLSHLMADGVLQSFFVGVLRDYRHFHREYNRLLQEHRKERKIKNAANPFPDLKEKEGFYELPLWLFDKENDRRSALYVKLDGDTYTFSDSDEITGTCKVSDLANYIATSFTLYPKAVFISIIMRRLVADLFIHGTGGETYDRFTDKLLEEFYDIQPGRYAIVSATYSLFPRELKEYAAQQEQLALIHKATSKPENYLKEGVFSDSGASELRQLSEQKQDLIKQLQSAGGDKDRISEVKKELNDVQSQIKKLVVSELTPEPLISDENAEVYRYRQFPHFLFAS